jgi:uncharacterized protein
MGKKPDRKPLIIRGALQVGKTWLIKRFGENEYEQVVYINFERSTYLQSLFYGDFDIKRIINALQINPENTLIIFDEIQEAERAITSLKYFFEDTPEYHIIAAGSLLGVALHRNNSFPVGKVDFLNLFPLNFQEFLKAFKEESLLELLKNNDWC